MLEVQNLSKFYGKFKAVDQATFQINQGSKVLLLGPNGAGKTTIIKCIMGLLNFKGSIKMEGVDVRHDHGKAKLKIGYVPQQFSFYDNISIETQAKYVARLKGINPSVVPEKLKKVNLWQHKNKRVKALSSGMRQRLAVGLA